MLENLLRGLVSIQKRHLYRYFVLPIALYSFQLWYYNKTPLTYLFKELRKIQRRAVLWTFCISPMSYIEAIASLIPIYLYLQKLNERFYFRVLFLLSNHIIKLILETRDSNNSEPH